MNEQMQDGKGIAIASMVLGIIALVLFWTICISFPCAVISIVLASVILMGQKEGKGMAAAGLSCSILTMVILFVMILFYNKFV